MAMVMNLHPGDGKDGLNADRERAGLTHPGKNGFCGRISLMDRFKKILLVLRILSLRP
jgi:hypothetical protein